MWTNLITIKHTPNCERALKMLGYLRFFSSLPVYNTDNVALGFSERDKKVISNLFDSGSGCSNNSNIPRLQHLVI